MFLSKTDTVTFRQEHELRLSNLEDILGKLTQTSEVCTSTFPQLEYLRPSTHIRLGAHSQPARKNLSDCCLLPLELILLLLCFTSVSAFQTLGCLFGGGLSPFLLEVTISPLSYFVC